MKLSPFLVIATLAFLAAAGCAGDNVPVRATVTVAEAMAADTVGYARATAVRPFVFPEDHGPHPDFKSEWWYLTGNLAAADGRRFGYELTIFRFALAPPDGTVRASAWATRQLYMGHFAVTDVAGRRFFPFERFSRGTAGLAGAQARPFRVWLEDWHIEADTTQPAPDPARPVMRLRAQEDGTGVDLVLRPLKPIVLQGDRGLDAKGDEPGNASYYYSMTRIATEGTVTVDGATFPVEGLSWMDREWSTSALGPDQVGWDWFALQLSDGRELMFYQLRERSGGISPTSDGVLVDVDGTPRRLDHTDVVVDVLDRWTSPHSGAVYPARWRLRVPREALDLTLTPLLADQEMNVSVRYWEGAVRVEGTTAGRPVDGYGYVELTGYDEAGVTPGG